MATFKVKDLMINVIPERTSAGGGTFLPGPDSDTSEFPPTITPVIMIARDSYKLEFLNKFKGNVDQLNPQLIDKVADKMGQLAMGGAITALCTQDMPTCDGRLISPVAMEPGRLTLQDLVSVKGLLKDAIHSIDQVEASATKRAFADEKLVSRLEAGVEALKERGC